MDGASEAAPVGWMRVRGSGSGRVDYGVGEAVAVDEGIGEAAPVVGLRMVSMMRICGRGCGVRSCFGGWVNDGFDDADLRPWTGVRSCCGRLDEGARKRI